MCNFSQKQVVTQYGLEFCEMARFDSCHSQDLLTMDYEIIRFSHLRQKKIFAHFDIIIFAIYL